MNYKEVHPLLDKNVTIEHVEEDTYILAQKLYNYQFYINGRTKALLDLVDGSNSIHEITQKYNYQSKIDLSEEETYQLLYSKFPSKGIIVDKTPVVKRRSAGYLTLRIDLIKSKWLQSFTKLFGFFFKSNVYIPFFTLFFFFLTYLLIEVAIPFYYQSNQVQDVSFGIVLLYLLVTSLVHELGHALAINAFGHKAGNIGFGFYLFSPIFYTDVSEAWALPKKKRILVNLAGIYAEMVLLITMVLMFFDTILISQFILVFFGRLVINLIPFLRFDGYWILSDISGYPNLNSNARTHVSKVLRALIKRQKIKFNLFLFIYGLCNILMIVLFLILIVSFLRSLLYFPSRLVELFKNFALFDELSLNVFFNLYLLPFIFYFLVIKWIISFSWKKMYQLKKRSLEPSRNITKDS